MNRTVLEACLPCLLALIVACGLVPCLVRCSGARWNLKRLGSLHHCQRGGVQSLSFVLTMPLFIMIVLFIVQVSQLMIATLVVHYAAFAAARSAIVWIPAELQPNGRAIAEPENVLPLPASESNPSLLVFRAGPDRAGNAAVWEYARESQTARSVKYANIFTAAALACSPLAPSRDLGYRNGLQNSDVAETLLNAYRTLAPSTAANPRLRSRIEQKIAYAFMNTAVRIEWVDRDSRAGPTYNPRVAIIDDDGRARRDQNGNVVRTWRSNEVGWEDPISITVTHEFTLLPGPGRFLSRFLVRADGRPDRISQRIHRLNGPENLDSYSTPVWATVTLTNEGMKPILPYVQHMD